MVTEMSVINKILVVICLVMIFGADHVVYARCSGTPDLSASVSKFEALQVSPLEALLRFGRTYDLCFGIEYVDSSFVRGKSNFTLKNTTIKEAIGTILGPIAPFSIAVQYDVIEIMPKTASKQENNLFDIVVHNWKTQRSSVQLASWLLHIQLVGDLNPQIKGFAGNYPTGDLKDEVGPFSESNQSVRELLDKIVKQSNGASWVSQIPPRINGIHALREGRRAWAVIEYQVPNTDFADAVNVLAMQIPQ